MIYNTFDAKVRWHTPFGDSIAETEPDVNANIYLSHIPRK